VIQLHNLPTMAEGRLCRVTARRDGGSISWDLDVAFDIHDETDAESVEPYLPGTVAVWCSGQEGGRGTVKVSGGFDLLHVAFNRDRELLATGHAEVRNCTTTVAAEQAVMVIRLRVHGLLPKAAAALAYELDEVLLVSMDSRELGLGQFPEHKEGQPQGDGLAGIVGDPDDTPEKAPHPLIGCLVVVPDGEDRLAGIVLDADHDGITVDTLEGGPLLVSVALDAVDNVLDVRPPAGVSMVMVVKDYHERSGAVCLLPSWHHVVEAIGELYSEGLLAATGGQWELSPSVIERAIAIAATTDSGVIA